MAKYALFFILQFCEGVRASHMRLRHCVLGMRRKTKIEKEAHHEQSCGALSRHSYWVYHEEI